MSVFLAVRAGITQPTEEQQVAYLLLVAFGAGFTERLVVRDPREESAERSTLAAETAARPSLDAVRMLDNLDDTRGTRGSSEDAATQADARPAAT